jgi:hypothetical protein
VFLRLTTAKSEDSTVLIEKLRSSNTASNCRLRTISSNTLLENISEEKFKELKEEKNAE